MEESSFLEGLEVLQWKREVGGGERLKMKSRERKERIALRERKGGWK